MTLTPTQALRDALVAARDANSRSAYAAVMQGGGMATDSVFSPYQELIKAFLGEHHELPYSPTFTQALDAFIELIDAGFDRLPSGTTIGDLYMRIAGERIRYKNWSESLASQVKELDARIKGLETELKKRPSSPPSHSN